MRYLKCFISLTILVLVFLGKTTPASAQTLTSFTFDNFASGSNKTAGLPFNLTITARDENGDVLTTFTETTNLTDTTGTIYPTQTQNFTAGIWSGQAAISEAQSNVVITVSSGSVDDNSASFIVDPDSRIKFLAVIAGNNQTGQVYTQLSTAFQVRSIDPYGNPLTNLGVNFAITSAPPNATGQSLTNYSTTTNSSGNATTLLTLGRKTGTYIVSAALTTGVATSVPFFATATAGPLISLGLSPAVAVVPAGGYFPFTVIGYDSFNNQTSDPSVTWSVQNGGGTIDSIGVFYAGSTLGTYMNTVKVQTTTIGTTATVAIVSAAGESGTATYSGVPQPTPLPTLTPVPTPTMGPGVLYDVQVDPSVISALTNARIPIIAEGVDIFGNQVTGVSYTFQTTGDLGTIVQTGPTTAILQTGPSGLGTVTVTAQQGAIIRTANIAGSIGNGLNRRLVIEDIPSPQKVGVPFTISIAAKDTQNNFVTDYDGPIVLADTTATINPSVVQPNQNGIWYIQAVINLANPEVTITAAGDGMVGVSNIFAVEGEPAQIPGLAALGYGGGGLGTVLGASISALLEKMLLTEDINRYGLFRYLGAGFAAGLGILGASIGGGLMVARGLEAIGRNPYAKSRLQLNLYASVAAFVFAATLAVVACYLILG
ncbi:hypothetical protein A2W24_02250 [Microgenomates group bacterium RBG_16_45_19]|nr:MAG: hypothetical protein A2W24_02250 [Microgenomates group bacterium RBG_16_45_19]